MFDLTKEKDKFLIMCKDTKGLSELTIKAYTIDLRQFCEFMESRNCFERNDLNNYMIFLHKQYKPKSAKRKIASIKSFYRYLEMETIIESNPFHKIILKYKEPVILPKTIPIESIKNILNYSYIQQKNAKSSFQKEVAIRNTIVLELLFATGMRVSEVSNLKIESLDLQSKTIYIHGKGSKERIMCIASKDLSNLIYKYIISHKDENEYVFINKLGKRFSEQSIRNMVNDYSKKAGIKIHITPHMFRHTFATALLDEDVDIRYIQQLLGHSSILTTQIYTHISTNKLRHILEDKHPRSSFEI